MNEPEKDIQKEVERRLKDYGIRYIHIPSDTYVKTGGHFKGVLDLLAFFRREDGFNYCLCLELKADKGKLSQGQKNWHKGLNVHVTYGMDEAIECVENWVKFIDEINY